LPTESRELLAVGIFGSKLRLGDRIEVLLRSGRAFSPRASVNSVAAITIVRSALIFTGSLAPRWIAFAQQQPRPAFEVASVKPTPAARRGFDFGTYFRSLPGGRFSAENEWTPDLASAPSLFTAIQEQLGLRLEARRERTEILVIDHVEKPDAN